MFYANFMGYDAVRVLAIRAIKVHLGYDSVHVQVMHATGKIVKHVLNLV